MTKAFSYIRGLVFVFLIFLSAGGARGTMDADTRHFVWTQANTLAAHARTPAEYREAARTYLRLTDDGVCNPALLQNLGAVLVMAGNSPQAIQVFERCERLYGISPETEAGSRAAFALRPQNESRSLPWMRTVFYPHYRYACLDRIVVAGVGIGCALVMLFLARLIRPLRKFFIAVSVCIGAIVFLGAISAGVSVFQEMTELPVTLPQEENGDA